MKNIQVIDGARNSEYALFSVSDEIFATVFPSEGQDIEFVEDVEKRLGEGAAKAFFGELYRSIIDKKIAVGIHGTLFIDLEFKRAFYPTKRETDLRAHTPTERT